MKSLVKQVDIRTLDKLNGHWIIKGTRCKILDSEIIIQSKIHRDVSYERFFNYLKSIKNDKLTFTKSQVKEYFPLNSIEYKILNKSLNNYNLNIIICDFNNMEKICEGLKFFVIAPDKDLLDNIYKKVYINNNPTTLQIRNPSSILIYLPINFTLSDLKHEFTHYLQFIKKDYKITRELDVSQSYFPLHILNTLKHVFDISDKDIDYFNELAEYEPLVNDTFDQLRLFKNKYYADLNDLDFARVISNILFKKANISNGAYLNKIIEYKYFNELIDFENLGLKLIIYFNLLNYRVTELKNLLFGYFNKSLNPKFRSN